MTTFGSAGKTATFEKTTRPQSKELKAAGAIILANRDAGLRDVMVRVLSR